MGVNRPSSPSSLGRAWYPSGPRLDGKRSESSYTPPAVDINPDPKNYKIELAEQIGDFLILKIKYPNCTNYEGDKILLFKGVTAIDLLKQKVIDPHFFKDPKIKSPIARFVPTEEGWSMAVRFAKMYCTD